MPVTQKINAKKERRGPIDVQRLAGGVDRIIVARGKSVVAFDTRKKPPPRALLLKHMLGPTGNLRAPTLRVGRTLLIGFDKASYENALTK